MSYFALRGLSVVLRQFRLHDIAVSLERGQSLALLGPSGSGKSVLLETIAGFHTPTSGSIELAGRDLTSLPPEERGLGFMCQDYALFPHLTVKKNVAFGLRRHPEAGSRTEEVLDLVGARHLSARRPANLSGGEKQRVALARALAIEPQLFLFDEPLSALDAMTRERLRDELRRLLRSLRATSIYVTHDRLEALLLGDRIGVMQDGVIRQQGEPRDLLAHPADAWVAGFLGMQVLRPGQYERNGPGRARARVGDGLVEATARPGTSLDDARLVFRPEEVHLERLAAQDLPVVGAIPAVVEAVVPLALFHRVDLDAGVLFSVHLSRQEQQRLDLRAGDKVIARFPPDGLLLVPQDARVESSPKQG